MVDTTYRIDADAGYFLARQLERIKSAAYEERFVNLKGRIHFPPGSEPSGPGAESFTHRVYTSIGMAAIVEAYSNDWPFSNVKTSEFTSPIKSLGSAYQYSFQDVRAAMFARRDLTTQLAIAARRAIAEKEDYLIYFGDPNAGLLGVLNNPNVPVLALPYGVRNGVDADNIIETFNVLINTTIRLTKGVEQIDTVLMPISIQTYLKSTRIADTNLTIFKFLQENYPNVEFDWSERLEGAGTGGTDVMLAYKRDEQHVYTEIASDFEQLPPDDNGAVTTIKCHERFGGVTIPYPLSFVKGELPPAA